MAVTTNNSSDKNGAQLDTLISTAQTAVNSVPASSTIAAQIAAASLRNLQIQAVMYYMSNGRINPATVLSTLT